MKDLKIGIYAICKNEINKIEFFLDKHKEADFIVILDTGSTDGTYEFLIEKSKNNNKLLVKQEIIKPFRFDTARNISYSLLPDFIDIAIANDIDEYFDEGWSDIIKNSWKEDSYRFWYDWHERNTNFWTKSFIHKKDNNIKWYYPVHEMIGTKDDEPKGIPEEIYPKINLILQHEPNRINHPRESLYTKLLPIRIAETKEDVYGKTMLAFEYGNYLSNPKKAALLSEEILKMKVSGEYEKHRGFIHIKQGIHQWFNQWGLKEYYDNENYKQALWCFQKAFYYEEQDIYKQNIKFAENKIKEKININKKYKISVYTITKNEEKFVDEWVDSMFEADEIVVLDTGSTDNTVEKLKARGVKVKTKIISPWRFDVARNESMKLISPEMDICISTDLDEKFEPGWADAIRKKWNENTDRGKYFYAWSHDENGNTEIKILYEKLHKNDRNWEWHMPVHEVLREKKNKEKINWVVFSEEEIMLHHYPDRTKSRSQYLNLMKLGIEEEPENMLQNYYYSRELFYHNRWEESIDHFKKTVKIAKKEKSKSYIAAIYGFMGEAYNAIGNIADAEISFIKGLKYTNNVREPYIKLIKFYYQKERWYSLIDIGLKSFELKSNAIEWYEDEKNYKEIPHDYLSVAYYNIGLYREALFHIEKAIEFNNKEERFHLNKKFILDKLSNE